MISSFLLLSVTSYHSVRLEQVSVLTVSFFSLFISPHSGGKKNSDSIMEVAASVRCKFSVFIMCALVEDDECCGLLKVMNIMTD